jgi:hypothetical protein
MYSHFCSFPGGRGAPKNSKIAVGSLKIDGTTFSQKNTNFSKIPPKMTPKSDPKNNQTSKKATRSTPTKTPGKQQEKLTTIVQKCVSKQGSPSHVKSSILKTGVASNSNVPQSAEKAPKVTQNGSRGTQNHLKMLPKSRKLHT